MKELEVLLSEDIFDKFKEAFELICKTENKAITFIVNDVRVILYIDNFNEQCELVPYENQKHAHKIG